MPLPIVSPPLPLPKLLFQPSPCSSMGAASGQAPHGPDRRARDICQTCVLRRLARRSPRRSWPCARKSRGRRGPRRPGPAYRSALPGSRRSGPFAPRQADSRDSGHLSSACHRAKCPRCPSRCPPQAPKTSSRPPPKPNVLTPIDSSAQLPARIIRSAQEIFLPYFCFIAKAAAAPCRGSRCPASCSGALSAGSRTPRHHVRRQCGMCLRYAMPSG